MTLGRPSSYTPEIAEEICAQVADGKPLCKLCDESSDLPSFRTVFTWLQNHPDFLQMYARAKEVMIERMAQEIAVIADNLEEDPNSRRVRVDSRKWLLSKLLPKVYGEAQLLKHADADGNVLRVEVTRVQSRKQRVIDVTPQKTGDAPAAPQLTPGDSRG